MPASSRPPQPLQDREIGLMRMKRWAVHELSNIHNCEGVARSNPLSRRLSRVSRDRFTPRNDPKSQRPSYENKSESVSGISGTMGSSSTRLGFCAVPNLVAECIRA